MEFLRQTLSLDELEDIDYMEDFVRPDKLAFHAIRDKAGNPVVLGPRFTPQLEGHISMTVDDVEAAKKLLLQHPDCQAWALVKRQMCKKLSNVVDAFVVSYLELGTDRKLQLIAALTSNMGAIHPGGFILRVAAAFGAATGRDAFPRRALVSACTGRDLMDDEFQYQRWPYEGHNEYNDINRFFMDLVMERIASIYWFDMHPGANSIVSGIRRVSGAIVSGVFGRLFDGTWFFYKDPTPGETDTKYPRVHDRVRGGSFHGEYVGLAFADLSTLLMHMDRRDVDVIARKMQVRNAIIRRADVLQALHTNVMDAVRFNGWQRGGSCGACPEGCSDAGWWEETVQDALVALDMSAQVAPSAIFSALTNQIIELLTYYPRHCYHEVAKQRLSHISDVGARSVDAVVAEILTSLTRIHSPPTMIQYVHLCHLRFTHDTISSTFTSGPHAGKPLTQMVADLHGNVLNPFNEPLILNVIERGGFFFTFNNRRLWCLQQYYATPQSMKPACKECMEGTVWGKIVAVRVWHLARGLSIDGQDVCEKFCNALSTRNNGIAVSLNTQS